VVGAIFSGTNFALSGKACAAGQVVTGIANDNGSNFYRILCMRSTGNSVMCNVISITLQAGASSFIAYSMITN